MLFACTCSDDFWILFFAVADHAVMKLSVCISSYTAVLIFGMEAKSEEMLLL